MKKLIAILLIIVFNLNTLLVSAETLQGGVEKTDTYEQQLQKELFTGEVEMLEKKDVINMTVSQVLDANISMEGDEFFAEVTSDVESDK